MGHVTGILVDNFSVNFCHVWWWWWRKNNRNVVVAVVVVGWWRENNRNVVVAVVEEHNRKVMVVEENY